MQYQINERSKLLDHDIVTKRPPHWVKTRLSGPGAIYNLGNVLALVSGVLLSLRGEWGQSSITHAIYTHLMGSPGAASLTISMVLFLVAGEIYHRAYQPGAGQNLVAWADFIAGLASVALTVALVLLGETVTALVAGFMLTVGKLGSAVLFALSQQGYERWDRLLRLSVVASRAPSILTLVLAVVPAVLGHAPLEVALLPFIMILCFLLWLWADLLLLRQG